MPEVAFGQGLTVTLEAPSVAATMAPPSVEFVVLPVAGPPGATGAAGGAPLVWDQTTPAATWTIPHGRGRLPASVVVIVDGEIVDTDTHVDETTVVLTFATPTAGRALIA